MQKTLFVALLCCVTASTYAGFWDILCGSPRYSKKKKSCELRDKRFKLSKSLDVDLTENPDYDFDCSFETSPRFGSCGGAYYDPRTGCILAVGATKGFLFLNKKIRE